MDRHAILFGALLWLLLLISLGGFAYLLYRLT